MSGCNSKSRQTASDGVVRLTYWSAPNPQERQLAQRLADAWNEMRPDVQVTVQALPAGQSSEEVLLAAIVAGTTPDLCSNIWPGIVGDFVRSGGVLALDEFPEFDSLASRRTPPELLETFRSPDGRFYQIPWKTNPIMMLYNVGIFREAGLEQPPQTYSEYLAAAQRITADTNGDGQLDRWMGYRDIRPIWWQRYFDYYAFYIAASGGKTLFHDGELEIDTAASTQVFGFFRDVYREKYFPVTTFQGNPLAAGRIATEFTGPWSIAWLEENAPPGLEYDFAPLPVPDGFDDEVYTYGDYKNIVIFANTKHPRQAWEFTQFLVSDEADLMLLEMTRQIPVRQGLLSDSLYGSFFAANPSVRPFAEQALRTRSVDAVPSFQEVLDALAQQFEAAAVYGVVHPATATERAIDRIRVIQEWAL